MVNHPTRVWVGAIGVTSVVAVVAALLILWRYNTPTIQAPQPDCRVVLAMIDYNKSQGRVLANAFDPEQGKEASISDYQAWANQMRGYAARISSPKLAAHAHRLADQANSLAELIKQVRSDTSVSADPGAPPPWAQTYADLGKQFQKDLAALNSACPNP